jgi:hypothetical protein
MEKKTQKGIHLGDLARGLLGFLQEAAAAPPWLEKDKTGKWPEAELPTLKQIAAQLADGRNKAAEEVEERYRRRRDDMKEAVQKRRKRLEAYAGRKRVVIAGEEDKFIVAGRVTDKTTGVGLPDVQVNAFDMDRKYDDRLGSTRTDVLGYFRIDYSIAQFKDFGEGMPETYIEVVGEDEETLYTSPKSFVQKAGKFEYFDARVPGAKVPRSLAVGVKIDRSLSERVKGLERRKRGLSYQTDF